MEIIEKQVNLPEQIKKKLSDIEVEIRTISKEADKIQNTTLLGKLMFEYKHGAPLDILTPFERAQSVCFITRYEHLPVLNNIDILESRGKFFVKNTPFIRHILNEYRPIIMNVKDSVYYNKIHKFCHEKLTNKDSKKGLCISVKHEDDGDVTDIFNRILAEKNSAIKYILKKCEFDYIYNGILQHSDHNYTTRFWEEYHTGKINYVFIKHAMLLGYVKDCLYWHYTILNQLTFPKLGPL